MAESKDKPAKNAQSLEETPSPWLVYAAQQAQLLQENLQQTFASASTRLSAIRSTSSAHFNQTLDSLSDFKSDYSVYEDAFFDKFKEGVMIAVSNPVITSGAVLGLAILGSKRSRRFLTMSASRLFMSEKDMLSRAEAKVSKLKESIEAMKSKSEKLEEKALEGEAELKRGKKKLRQAGKQIQDVIGSVYKIERQARGLKDIGGELPNSDASLFRKKVSDLASEAKLERNVLTKEVSKIINYGIPI